MKRVLIMMYAACLMASAAMAQEVIRLYPGEAPGSEGEQDYEMLYGEGTIVNVVNPTMTVYHPDKGKANGAAMLVIPGGGFTSLSWRDGGDSVARWLSEQGFTAIALKYRVVNTGHTPEEVKATQEKSMEAILEFLKTGEIKPAKTLDSDGGGEKTIRIVHQGYDDARQAMKLIRAHAEEWGINKDRIGIIGFSAGAMITLEVAANHTEDSKPNFCSVIYGAWLREYIDVERPIIVPQDAAPMFICSPVEDIFEPSDILSVYTSWRSHKTPVELHFFPYCMHGFGVGNNNGKNVGKWTELMLGFMKDCGFLQE